MKRISRPLLRIVMLLLIRFGLQVQAAEYSGVEEEIAVKTASAAQEIVRQLEQRGLMEGGSIIVCVLPTRDAFGKTTVLGKNASEAIARAFLKDKRIELATELSVAATDYRVAGTIYEMEGRRMQITFRCGNNPADPYSEQRYHALASVVISLPSDARLRSSLMQSVDTDTSSHPQAHAIAPLLDIRSQKRTTDGIILTEALPLMGGKLRSGEQFQIELHNDAPDLLFPYLIWRDTHGEYFCAWPPADTPAGSDLETLPPNRSTIIPRISAYSGASDKSKPQWFALDEQNGTETVHIFAHTGRKDGVASFLDLLNSKPAAERDELFSEWASSFAWHKTLIFDHLPIGTAPAPDAR